MKNYEWSVCKSNPLYFISKYCKSVELDNSKHEYTIECLKNGRNVILMSPRQTGKSHIGAAILSWASVFYPNNSSIMLNMSASVAINNINIIKNIINELPEWMVTSNPFKSDIDIKTYINLFNDSKINILYPSTINDPDTVAKSLISPILWIDEASYIPRLNNIYGAALQTLVKARTTAIKNNMPSFIFVTSLGYKPTGWLYDKMMNDAKNDWEVIKMNLDDCKLRYDIDEIKSELNDDVLFRREYLLEFI